VVESAQQGDHQTRLLQQPRSPTLRGPTQPRSNGTWAMARSHDLFALDEAAASGWSLAAKSLNQRFMGSLAGGWLVWSAGPVRSGVLLCEPYKE